MGVLSTRSRIIIVVVASLFFVLGAYLITPLFFDVTVNEESPFLVDNEDPAFVAIPQDAVAGGEIASGTFIGADDFHLASGKASIVRSPDDKMFLRFEDFSVTNGPDLFVYLAKSENVNEGFVDLGRLKGNIGDQNYEIPDMDVSEFKTAVIWCRAFGVLFGSAKMN